MIFRQRPKGKEGSGFWVVHKKAKHVKGCVWLSGVREVKATVPGMEAIVRTLLWTTRGEGRA